jgi:hypothetical protein
MKKLFLLILVLGFLLSGNAYAKNTNLVCEEKESKNTTHIIYNEKLAKEELVLSLDLWTDYKSVEITENYLKFRNFEGDKLLGEWIINRYTGEAKESTSGFLTSYWDCKVSKKLF